MKVQIAVALVASVLGSPVWAQSSLGISGATFSLGSIEDEAGTQQVQVASSVVHEVGISDAITAGAASSAAIAVSIALE